MTDPSWCMDDATEVVGATSGPTSTSSTFAVIPEMSIAVATRGRPVMVHFDGTFTITATLVLGDQVEIALFRDGVEIPNTRRSAGYGSGLAVSSEVPLISEAVIHHLPAASYTFDCRFRRPSGTGTARCFGTYRKLIISQASWTP